MAIAVGIDAARTDVANDGLYRTLGLAVGGMASGIRSVRGAFYDDPNRL
jgi:hypothetical protein